LPVEPKSSTFSEPAEPVAWPPFSVSPYPVGILGLTLGKLVRMAHQLRMHRAANADRLEAARPGTRPVIQEPRDHRRHGGPAIDLLPLDQFHHWRIEPAARHDQRVTDDNGAQQRLHLADVKQRPVMSAMSCRFVDLVEACA
jgi:hypothetical protein